jgi:tetratricopeptide (TPR) repeat protein
MLHFTSSIGLFLLSSSDCMDFLRLRAHLEEKRYAQEALALAQTINDRGGIVIAQIVMGRAALKLGNYEEARHLLEQNLPLCKELFPSAVWYIVLLGEIALALGDHRQARRCFHEALQGGYTPWECKTIRDRSPRA